MQQKAEGQSQTTTNKNEHVFKDMPVSRALWTFALPSIISQLILLIYNLADTYFLGRVGNPYMVAAVSLVLPVYNICVCFANLFGTGGGTLISRLLGSQSPDEAKKVSAFSVVMSIVFSACFALLIFAFQRPLLTFLGASEYTIGYAVQYSFWVLVIGGVPTVLSITMSNLARNAGLSKEAGIGTSCAGLLNIILDPLFMFVIMPSGMEVVGAAVATMISNTCNVIYFIFLFRANRGKSVLRIIPRAGMPSANSIQKIVAVGVPSALTTLLYDLTNIVIDKLSATHGDIPLAAIGIVLKAERLPLNIGVGLCLGMVPLIGYNYAAGNFDRMKKIHRTTQFYGLVISAVCIVLYELGAGLIMNIFISDAQTVALGTTFLRVRCLATFMMFACFNYCFFFQAVGMGKQSLALAVIRQLVFNIPLLLILNSLFGMMGIVWTQFIADACTAVISVIFYRRVARRTWDAPKPA